MYSQLLSEIFWLFYQENFMAFGTCPQRKELVKLLYYIICIRSLNFKDYLFIYLFKYSQFYGRIPSGTSLWHLIWLSSTWNSLWTNFFVLEEEKYLICCEIFSMCIIPLILLSLKDKLQSQHFFVFNSSITVENISEQRQ